MSNIAKKDVLEEIPCTKPKIFFFWDEDSKTSLVICLCCFVGLLVILLLLICCCCYQRRRCKDSREPWYKCPSLRPTTKDTASSLNPKKSKCVSKCMKKPSKADYECLPDCPPTCNDRRKHRDNCGKSSKRYSTSSSNKTHKDTITKDYQCYTQYKQSKESIVKFEKETPKLKRHSREIKKHKRSAEKKKDREENDAKSSDKSVVLTLKVGLPKHAYLREPNTQYYTTPPCESSHKQYVLSDSSTGQSTEEFKKYYDEMKRKQKDHKPIKTKLFDKTTDLEHKASPNIASGYNYQENRPAEKEKYQRDKPFLFAQHLTVNETLVKHNPTFTANDGKLANMLNKSNIPSLTSKISEKVTDIPASFRNYQAVPERLIRSDALESKYPNACGIYLGNNFGKDSLEILNELRNMDPDNTPEKDSMEILQELLNDTPNLDPGSTDGQRNADLYNDYPQGI